MLSAPVRVQDLYKQRADMRLVRGTASTGIKLIYRMRDALFSWGSLFVMARANRAIVQRSWGMFELQHAGLVRNPGASYGPNFQYDEFLFASNPISALFNSVTFAVVGLLFLLPPVRGLNIRHAWQC